MRLAARVAAAGFATAAATMLMLAPAAAAAPAAAPAAITLPAVAALPGAVVAGQATLPQSPPVNVGTQQIDDQAGTGANTSAAQQALDSLRSNAHIGLYVVLIKSFDGVDKQAWAQQSFTASDLGSNDILLAIATQDRRFGFQAGVSGQPFPLTQSAVNDILNNQAAPHMSNNDWSGAIVAAAQGLQQAVATGGTAGNSQGNGAAPGTSTGSGHGSLAWIWIVVILAIAVIAFLWFRATQRRKRAAAEAKKNAGPPPEPYEHLSDRSVNALIQTDNAVRASESELQLAEGEFGAEATADFRAAHDDAKAKLTKAFQLRQEIDDEIPEDEATRRGWMAQIIELCQQASDGLEAQTERFSSLRDLRSRLPQVLALLPADIDAQASRLPQAAATLQRLAGAYSERALATVSGNTDQANERLQFARASLDEARKAAAQGGAARAAAADTAAAAAEPPATDGTAAGGGANAAGSGAAGIDTATIPATDATGSTTADGSTASGDDAATGAAVLAARATQEAIKQATTLLDAIDRLDHDLAAAAAQLAAARSHVTGELADARSALTQGSAGAATADIQQRLAAVQSTLDATSTADAGRNPVTSLKELTDADRALDDILAATRTAQQQEKRARATLQNELVTAQSTVSAVDDYISTRRGAMNSTARTRLAEAQRHLAQAQAEADTDATSALAEARQATDLARQAYAEARNDMDNWTGGPGRGSPMSGIGGAILGGILINSVLNAGHRGGGWGGGFGGFGGGGFGGGGGGFGGGGSFGGGGGGFGGGGSF